MSRDRLMGMRVVGEWEGVAEIVDVRNVPLGPADWYAVVLLRLENGLEVWVPAEKTGWWREWGWNCSDR